MATTNARIGLSLDTSVAEERLDRIEIQMQRMQARADKLLETLVQVQEKLDQVEQARRKEQE